MSISAGEVEQIARLARLELEEGEVEAMARELGSILDHIQELEKVDTEGLPPMRGVSEHAAPMRADETGADPLQLKLSELAPRFESHFFVVPRLAALDGDAVDQGDSA